MYVIRHKTKDLYLYSKWSGITYNIDNAKLFTRRPLASIRYWNNQYERGRSTKVTWQGEEIDMRDFEIRPITINVL